ncbi:multidrug efflux SMR transporter [Rhodobacteraceae bacterium NNCM2]|nr:multidrug efflux SMR transporter [Coraliihabitans acroporae]
MSWFLLIFAGLLEVVWASGLKQLGDRFSPLLLALTVVAMVASLAALYASMTRLPLGIAYPIWTGIGSIGSVAVGALVFGHNLSLSGIIGLVLLVVGMALLGAEAH